MEEGERRFAAELPGTWPERRLWLVAVDIVSGSRIVLGSRQPPPLGLQQAVMASCAIPGVYPPVRLGRRLLVDGGAHSTTNLDLVVRDGCELVIGVAPMAFDPGDPPDKLAQLVRRIPTRSLAAEAGYVRQRGIDVLLLRPSARDVAAHGLRMMRAQGLDRVTRAAYESTARAVTAERFQQVLGDLAA
jgi:NTE family protein